MIPSFVGTDSTVMDVIVRGNTTGSRAENGSVPESRTPIPLLVDGIALVTLHLWRHIYRKFPGLEGLTYTDDGNIIGPLSPSLKPISVLKPITKPVFKKDGKLDFKIGKT